MDAPPTPMVQRADGDPESWSLPSSAPPPSQEWTESRTRGQEARIPAWARFLTRFVALTNQPSLGLGFPLCNGDNQALLPGLLSSVGGA